MPNERTKIMFVHEIYISALERCRRSREAFYHTPFQKSIGKCVLTLVDIMFTILSCVFMYKFENLKIRFCVTASHVHCFLFEMRCIWTKMTRNSEQTDKWFLHIYDARYINIDQINQNGLFLHHCISSIYIMFWVCQCYDLF